jgi:hypothetical protein
MRPPVATRHRSHWSYNRRLRELHRFHLQISKAVARSQERGPVLPRRLGIGSGVFRVLGMSALQHCMLRRCLTPAETSDTV